MSEQLHQNIKTLTLANNDIRKDNEELRKKLSKKSNEYWALSSKYDNAQKSIVRWKNSYEALKEKNSFEWPDLSLHEKYKLLKPEYWRGYRWGTLTGIVLCCTGLIIYALSITS